MKKGRHRRFEEARALKRSHEVDLEDIFEDITDDGQQGEHKPEHDAWADLAEEWEQKDDDGSDDVASTGVGAADVAEKADEAAADEDEEEAAS